MLKKLTIFLLLYANFAALAQAAEAQFRDPRIAIIISRSSVEHRWGVSQMAAHGWAGIANLAGLPYDCLFIDDLTEMADPERYDLLLFAQCGYIEDRLYDPLCDVIASYIDRGGSILLDGAPGMNNENARERDYDRLFELLGIRYEGFHGDSTYRLKVENNYHYE